MQKTIQLNLDIQPEQQGSYFTLPFDMPENTGRMTLRYDYTRRENNEIAIPDGFFTSQPEINIVDLGLIAPDGRQVGASGSDKTRIFIDEVRATPGYTPCKLVPGAWKILVGAYKIAPEGCQVRYEITLDEKEMRLLRGDLHTHTLASDGVLSKTELGQRAVRHGLDFLAITDHNQVVSAAALPDVPGLTLIAGVEWTHYQGHAIFLGADSPYDSPFACNSPEEALERFKSARQNGALIIISHPLEPGMGFQYDLETFPFDCLEIWNGPMRESNLKAVGLWQSLLKAGRKIPISGGSDYHRDTPFIFPGGPTTCVYAMSASADDILTALRQGHSYLIFAPDGPTLMLEAGEAILGDTVAWQEANQMQITVGGLLSGDTVRVVTGSSSEVILQASTAGRLEAAYKMDAPGFARVEVLRAFLPGIPMLPALLSNPIYFVD